MPIPEQLDHDSEMLRDTERCRAYVKQAGRGIVTRHNDLEIFTEVDHSAELKMLARGMTLAEICDFYGLDYEALPSNDKFFLCTMFLKGRVNGVFEATSKLFTQMSGRDGMKASLSYLDRFAENWKGAQEDAEKHEGSKHLRIEIVDE